MSFVGEASFILHHQQYGQGDFYKTQKDAFVHYFCASLAEGSWERAIADFEGVGSIPMMTMHKSKGLEYHTVVFVGLEDAALFGWDRDAREEGCGFFVAFSRAMKRVVFTFSGQRPDRKKRFTESQSRDKIKILYDLLIQAGVQPESIE